MMGQRRYRPDTSSKTAEERPAARRGIQPCSTSSAIRLQQEAWKPCAEGVWKDWDAAVPLTSGIFPTDNTGPSVCVSRLANGSPRTGCRGRALALGSFRMLSPKSAHGLLATPGSWVKSENAP